MTTQEEGTPQEEPTTDEAKTTTIELSYQGESEVVEQEDQTKVVWALNMDKDAPTLEGGIKDPLLFREALTMLYDVVRSNHRHAPKNRASYLEYQRSKGGASSDAAFSQQSEFFEQQDEDQGRWFVMDPTVTVHPDQLTLEVFSKDEGTYASLAIDMDAFETKGKPSFGTAQIDFSQALHDSLGHLRSWRATNLEFVSKAKKGEEDAVRDATVEVPNLWLRGFLQVQASATLAQADFSLSPVDLYNILRHLRLNADQKKGGRAIRAELIPGQMPKVVLEPWEEVVETSAAKFEGEQAQIFRIWGRRRLQMLRRMLPFIERVDVHLLGTGMPSFYVLHCGVMTLTFGLSGFTSSNWAQTLGFDTLLPRGGTQKEVQKRANAILKHLEKSWFATTEELAKALKATPDEVHAAARIATQQGQLLVDLGKDGYRLRPLSNALDLDALKYRSPREQQAHDLLEGRGGSITIESVELILGQGTKYVATVAIEEDQRSYRCEMMLDKEGRARKIDDTSPFFQKHQLKEGPSVPLITLRLKIAQLEEERANQAAGEISSQTRTYVKRQDHGETIYELSFHERGLRVHWGLRSETKRRTQRLAFNSVDAAREAYFQRIEDLEAQGYMDASAT